MSTFLELLTGGFYAALSKFETKFLTQQEARDMALAEKLTQVLQNQQASTEAIAAIGEAINTETSQVSEAVTTLTNTNAQQAQTIEEQRQQIKDLLAQVESGQTQLTEAEAVVDQIIQKQLEQVTAQQEATSKISAIFS